MTEKELYYTAKNGISYYIESAMFLAGIEYERRVSDLLRERIKHLESVISKQDFETSECDDGLY